jgi:hypothetical protein
MILPDLFFQRKYGIILVLFIFHAINGKLCEAQSLNSFRSARSGDFNNLTTWEKFNGQEWLSAERLPGREDEIYIEKPHEVRLTRDEEVSNVFIFADNEAGSKLNLNGFGLHVYGSLNAYKGVAPGEPSRAWNSTNWIGNSLDSRIIFKGESRVVIRRGYWSGQSTYSRFTVVFDPGEDKELIVEEPIKSIGVTIKSGTVSQKLNLTNSNCSSFSGTNNANYGRGFVQIQSGGKLLTDCKKDIAFLSANNPMDFFRIEPGGSLELLADRPELIASELVLHGSVIYAAAHGNQYPLKNGTGTITEYHNLIFRNGAAKNFPPEITLTGNFIYENGGDIRDASTQYFFRGEHNQMINRQSKPIHKLQVDKSAGEVSFQHNVIIQNGLEHVGGDLNFNGNSLRLKSPDYFYLSGSWRNLSQFVFEQVPTVLDELNGKFPFYDMQLGGQRSFKVMGAPGATSIPLAINYVEKPGVNWDAGFLDHDGTPILYKLNSYFEVVTAPPGFGDLDLKIDAEDLIVTDPLHLRVVSDQQAAPGIHLEGLDLETYWARRNLSFGELTSQTFTIGSTTFPSILPLTWVGLWVNSTDSGAFVQWEVAQERDNKKFVVYRSDGNVNEFYAIGEVESLGDGDERRSYGFMDQQKAKNRLTYYQIRQVDIDGKSTYSDVVLLRTAVEQIPMFKVYPTPHYEGPIKFNFSPDFQHQTGLIKITGATGMQVMLREGVFGEMVDLPEILQNLAPGLYLIECVSGMDRQVLKFFKF